MCTGGDRVRVGTHSPHSRTQTNIWFQAHSQTPCRRRLPRPRSPCPSACWATESVRNSYNSSASTRRLLSSLSRAYSPTLPQGVFLLPFTHPRPACYRLSSKYCHVHLYSELLIIFQHHPFHPASQNAPRALYGTRVTFLLLKQFSSDLDTEAEAFLTLLTRRVARLTPVSVCLGE